MARERELPLVLAVDCCRDDALERDALAGVARFRSVSSEDEACASLVEEATVLVVRTASPQPPVVARAVFMPALVVALGSPDAAAETAAARRAGATRFLHAPLDATDALADTAATLALDGARRTHRLAARLRDGGAWSPPPEELRGARRVKDLTVGLVGIDAVALAWVMSQPFVDVCLSGAATVEQLKENAAALAITPLSDETMRLLADTMAIECEAYWAERRGLAWN